MLALSLLLASCQSSGGGSQLRDQVNGVNGRGEAAGGFR